MDARQCQIRAFLYLLCQPEERLRMEQEEAERAAEEARKEELRAYCRKKGLSYEREEEKYQKKLADKKAGALNKRR